MTESLGRQSLGGAFGRGGLGGRLATRAPQTPPAPLAPPEEPVTVAKTAEPLAPALVEEVPTKKRANRKKEKDRSDTELIPVALHIPESIVARLRAVHAASPGATYASVVIAAVDSTWKQLQGAFTDADVPSGPLAPQPRTSATRPGDRVQQVLPRLTRANLAALDKLKDEAKAPSRSAYVSAALDAYLPFP